MTSPGILKEAEIANPRGGVQNRPIFIMFGKLQGKFSVNGLYLPGEGILYQRDAMNKYKSCWLLHLLYVR